MAFSSAPNFEKRRRQIVRTRRSLARYGGELEMRPDGLLTVRRRRGLSGIPYQGLFVLGALLFGAKSLMLVQDGAQTYGERVSNLADGGTVERVGAWVMQIDPLTAKLAEYLMPLFG